MAMMKISASFPPPFGWTSLPTFSKYWAYSWI